MLHTVIGQASTSKSEDGTPTPAESRPCKECAGALKRPDWFPWSFGKFLCSPRLCSHSSCKWQEIVRWESKVLAVSRNNRDGWVWYLIFFDIFWLSHVVSAAARCWQLQRPVVWRPRFWTSWRGQRLTLSRSQRSRTWFDAWKPKDYGFDWKQMLFRSQESINIYHFFLHSA